MQIECPSCKTDNKVEFGDNILCNECKESFGGHSYKKFKKPLISASTALFIGAFGAYKLDKNFIEQQRYPVELEYELINSCVNSDRSALTSSLFVNKTKACICTLEKTMDEVSYKQLKESESTFVTHFRSNINLCS
ncbi:hypothetical protein [Pseudoalteromonas sp. T1lg88]|uniref:hypothetical protein n=1 Tax=Pseudoalteromonas sp. T1lg88 TaxID=2077104 RepID=UPI000CF741C4|nr:hypothetical protein [Pseudoalteromonas sp. T1lg88]